jgi:hypothetical protein
MSDRGAVLEGFTHPNLKGFHGATRPLNKESVIDAQKPAAMTVKIYIAFYTT